jgi:hypothetical protein
MEAKDLVKGGTYFVKPIQGGALETILVHKNGYEVAYMIIDSDTPFRIIINEHYVFDQTYEIVEKIMQPKTTESHTPSDALKAQFQLTRRDMFAMAAMQGFAANPEWHKTQSDMPDDWDIYIERVTSGAVELADALIKKLDEVQS